MKTISTLHVAAAALAIASAVASPAASAAQRAFVASTGTDANPCSVTQPCRTFGAAIASTIAGGEVVVLDSAGYGAFTIDKAVSVISPPGIYAGISVASGDGITIAAGATDVVKLRGLRINGTGGANGIVATTVGLLDIANVEVSGLTGRGLDFAAPNARLTVTDSVFAGNGGHGLNAQAATGKTVVTILRSRFDQNGAYGMNLGANVTATIAETSASNNATDAFGVIDAAVATFTDCRITNAAGSVNTRGIHAEGTGTRVAVARCAVSGMQYGIVAVLSATIDVMDTTVNASSVGYEAHYSGVVNAERSSATNGNNGFLATSSGSSIVRMSNCSSTFNTNGVNPQPGGVIYSRQNNTIRNNVTDVFAGGGSFTTFLAQ